MSLQKANPSAAQTPQQVRFREVEIPVSKGASKLEMDRNYKAYLEDAPELQKTLPGRLVVYFQGQRIADGKDAQELAANIPPAYRKKALFIKAVPANPTATPIKFRRPFFRAHS